MVTNNCCMIILICQAFSQFFTFPCIYLYYLLFLYSSVQFSADKCCMFCTCINHITALDWPVLRNDLSISMILTACRIMDIAVSRSTVHLQIKPTEFTSFLSFTEFWRHIAALSSWSFDYVVTYNRKIFTQLKLCKR